MHGNKTLSLYYTRCIPCDAYLYLPEVGNVILDCILQIDGDLQNVLVVIHQKRDQSCGKELIQTYLLLAAQHTAREGVHHLKPYSDT